MGAPSVDRTAKMFIGGKQARPMVASINITAPPEFDWRSRRGQPRDIRNAVEAARAAAEGWRKSTAHNKAQILYFLAENLAARWMNSPAASTPRPAPATKPRTRKSKPPSSNSSPLPPGRTSNDGAIHGVPQRNVTLAINEPIGVLAIPAAGRSTLARICRARRARARHGQRARRRPLAQIPAGVTDPLRCWKPPTSHGTVNIVTGKRDELAKTLSEHEDVDAIWYAGSSEGQAAVQKASAGNMKRTWVMEASGALPAVEAVLREATKSKYLGAVRRVTSKSCRPGEAHGVRRGFRGACSAPATPNRCSSLAQVQRLPI